MRLGSTHPGRATGQVAGNQARAYRSFEYIVTVPPGETAWEYCLLAWETAGRNAVVSVYYLDPDGTPVSFDVL